VVCQSPFHKKLIEYNHQFAKYLPRTRGYRKTLPRLSPSQERITLCISVLEDGLEIGRFTPYSACPFCWSVMLNAVGLRPENLAEIAPEQTRAIFKDGYKWVNAVKEGKQTRKKWSKLERDIRLAKEATLETLRQLGILKDTQPNPL